MNQTLVWVLTMAISSLTGAAAAQEAPVNGSDGAPRGANGSRTFTSSALGYQLVTDARWEALDADGIASIEKSFQQGAGSGAAVRLKVPFAVVSADESGNSMLMALQVPVPPTVAKELAATTFLAGVRASVSSGGAAATTQVPLGGEMFSLLAVQQPAPGAPRMRVFVTIRHRQLLAFIAVGSGPPGEAAIDDVLRTLTFSAGGGAASDR